MSSHEILFDCGEQNTIPMLSGMHGKYQDHLAYVQMAMLVMPVASCSMETKMSRSDSCYFLVEIKSLQLFNSGEVPEEAFKYIYIYI